MRRVHLEKPGTSKTRPIGIPTLEDKIFQRAVLMVLEPVYEQDFVECSYEFRPGRGAYQALDALWYGLKELGGGWAIDLDIEDFLGSVAWGHLRSFLDRRVRDGVIRRARRPRSGRCRVEAPSRRCFQLLGIGSWNTPVRLEVTPRRPSTCAGISIVSELNVNGCLFRSHPARRRRLSGNGAFVVTHSGTLRVESAFR